MGARVANFLSLVYCRLAFIPVLESADLPFEGKTPKNLENPSEKLGKLDPLFVPIRYSK